MGPRRVVACGVMGSFSSDCRNNAFQQKLGKKVAEWCVWRFFFYSYYIFMQHIQCVMHKKWDHLCFRKLACYKTWTLLFGVHWNPGVKLFWWHPQKTEECTSIGCLLSFCMVYEIFLCPGCQAWVWWDHWSLLSMIVSNNAISSHLYTLLATPTTKYFHLADAGAHLVCWHQRRSGAKVSNWGSSSFFSAVALHAVSRVATSMSGFPCTNGRSVRIQSFRHKKVVLFTLSGQFLGCFTLRLSFEAIQRSSLPSFYLYLLFPTACLTFNFSSLMIIPQNPIEGAQGNSSFKRCQTAFAWPNSSEV